MNPAPRTPHRKPRTSNLEPRPTPKGVTHRKPRTSNLEPRTSTGPLEATNRPYAVAKIAGIETCWAYNRQYNTQFLAVMPTNLYGPGDNYDLENSHVLPALIRKKLATHSEAVNYKPKASNSKLKDKHSSRGYKLHETETSTDN